MSIIQVENLAYHYPGVDDTPGIDVFKDLNLKIEQGSFVAVLGSNGSGKSTLAKHFNAILLPCGGSVYVSGMDTKDEEKLLATMTEEQKELFSRYTDCVREHQAMSECLLFQNSFRLGGRMMLEVMRGGAGDE